MRNAYSVSQVNTYIKNMFRQDYLLSSLLVRGEVSNCKYHSSGHIYFTLKDSQGTLACVMFAGSRRGLAFQMREGDAVIVQGTVDVYERDGKYQLYARQIIRDGIGALNERYEQLKKQLEEEGLFDEMYKQPIPKYIRTLGVVTAPTGAAVQDIMNIALRRNPWLRIILFPAIVQGDAAKNSIVSGIRAFNSMPEKERPEVIIIGRGGGSLEDLWAFNEEAVARAVFDSEIPIISAVGHETDTVITDYVADLRAPTPSAAAELAVDETERLLGTLEQYRQSLTSAMEARTERVRMRLRSSELLLSRLSPSYRIREQRMRLTQAEDALGERMRRIVEDRRHRAEKAALMLDALSPLKRLSGGYGYVTGGDGRPLTRISGVKAGDSIAVRLRDGRIGAKVTEAVPDVE